MGKTEGCLFGFFLAVFGAALVLALGPQLLDYLNSNTWESTNATIVSSELEFLPAADADSEDTWAPRVEYRYEVGDTIYTRNRIRFTGSDSYADSDDARRVVNNYEVGRIVTVYYSPDDPTDAVLEREIDNVDVFFICVGALLMLGGIAVLFFNLRSRAMMRV